MLFGKNLLRRGQKSETQLPKIASIVNGNIPVDGEMKYAASDEEYRSMAPYIPWQLCYDYGACICNEEDVSFNDYLGDITVPVFYLRAGGAMGSLGDYSTNLTSSTDIIKFIVSANEDRLIDFGHADLFFGRNTDDLGWGVLYSWLITHAKANNR